MVLGGHTCSFVSDILYQSDPGQTKQYLKVFAAEILASSSRAHSLGKSLERQSIAGTAQLFPLMER